MSSITSLLVCAYRSLSVETCECIIATLSQGNWRYNIRYGDALISRARSIVASQWYRDTSDDVFVMVDDDIVFSTEVSNSLVQHCRSGKDIVVAGYPVHNGQYLSSETLDGKPLSSDAQSPVELRFAAGGCMAVHRRVLDALIPSLPLCHANTELAFWPFFLPLLEYRQDMTVYLSEDFAFTYRAREAGMRAWIDPHLSITHLSQVGLSLANMSAVHLSTSAV